MSKALLNSISHLIREKSEYIEEENLLKFNTLPGYSFLFGCSWFVTSFLGALRTPSSRFFWPTSLDNSFDFVVVVIVIVIVVDGAIVLANILESLFKQLFDRINCSHPTDKPKGCSKANGKTSNDGNRRFCHFRTFTVDLQRSKKIIIMCANFRKHPWSQK
jgi:hypothetical protein